MLTDLVAKMASAICWPHPCEILVQYCSQEPILLQAFAESHIRAVYAVLQEAYPQLPTQSNATLLQMAQSISQYFRSQPLMAGSHLPQPSPSPPAPLPQHPRPSQSPEGHHGRPMPSGHHPPDMTSEQQDLDRLSDEYYRQLLAGGEFPRRQQPFEEPVQHMQTFKVTLPRPEEVPQAAQHFRVCTVRWWVDGALLSYVKGSGQQNNRPFDFCVRLVNQHGIDIPWLQSKWYLQPSGKEGEVTSGAFRDRARWCKDEHRQLCSYGESIPITDSLQGDALNEFTLVASKQCLAFKTTYLPQETGKVDDSREAFLVLQLVRYRHLRELEEEVLSSRIERRPFGNRNGVEEADGAGRVVVSLKDVFSRTDRIKIPAKGRRCRHEQCYELSCFLYPRRRAYIWHCPICKSPLPFSDLMVDEAMHDVLLQTSQDTEEICVNPDGSWEAVRAQPTTSGRPQSVSGDGGTPTADQQTVSAADDINTDAGRPHKRQRADRHMTIAVPDGPTDDALFAPPPPRTVVKMEDTGD